MGNVAFVFVPFGTLFNAIGTCNYKNKINWIDPTVIALTVAWSVVIESLPVDELVRPWSDSAHGLVSGIIASTLGFLLPLYLNDAMGKNKTGNALFEAFCGDVVALAWEMAIFGSKSGSMSRLENKTDVNNEYTRVFAIMRTMPQTLKHMFRGDFKYKYMAAGMKEGPKKKNMELVVKKMRELDSTGEHAMEATMFLLMHHIRRLINLEFKNATKEDKQLMGGRQASMTVLMTKWNNIYGSYGALSSLSSYKRPQLFQYVLYTALIFYVVLLPWSYSDKNSWNVFITFGIIYFFVSLGSAGHIIENPFVHLGKHLTIFQTTSGAARANTQLINDIEQYGLNEQIWKKGGGEETQGKLVPVSMSEKIPVNFQLNNFVLRQRLSKGNYKNV